MMIRTVRAVVFDLGGTLVDPYSLTPLRALHNAFKKNHIYLTTHDINRYMGVCKKTHIQSLLRDYYNDIYRAPSRLSDLDRKVDRIHRVFQVEHDRLTTNNITLLPGALDIHNFLRDKGIKIGVTTGYSIKEAEPILEHLDSQGFTVDKAVTSDMVKLSRPYPGMMFEVMKGLEIECLDASSVLKVDDSISGLDEGRRAGSITVGLAKYSSMMGPFALQSTANGPYIHTKIQSVKDKMIENCADYVLDDLHDLHNILQKEV